MKTLESKYVVEPHKKGYTVDGAYYPRITTVLGVLAKPELEKWKINRVIDRAKDQFHPFYDKTIELKKFWIDSVLESAKNEPDRIKDEAADIGTRVHNAIDDEVKGITPKVDTDMVPALEAFHSWRKSSGIVLLPGEIRLGSKKHGYAGTMDGLGMMGKDLVLTDWKTSKSIRWEYALQVAAYWEAYAEQYNQRAKRAFIVRFDKNPQAEMPFEVKEIKNIVGALGAFLNCLAIYNAKKEDFYESE